MSATQFCFQYQRFKGCSFLCHTNCWSSLWFPYVFAFNDLPAAVYSFKTQNPCGQLFEETNTCIQARNLIRKRIEVSCLTLKGSHFPSCFFMYSLVTEIFGVDNKTVRLLNRHDSYVTSVPPLENVCHSLQGC